MTDKPTDYRAEDESAIYDSLGDIPEDAEGFEVECDLEWSGEMETNPRRMLRLNPQNRVHDYVQLDQVREAKKAADTARAQAANPPWAKSYTAKSWGAQLRHLQRTGVGRAALAEFVTATPRTQAGWAKGGKASNANRAAIARAYETVATRASRPTVEAEAGRTRHALAQALSAAIQSTTGGVPVRIFRPGRFEWK